jgi:hypothetical protein
MSDVGCRMTDVGCQMSDEDEGLPVRSGKGDTRPGGQAEVRGVLKIEFHGASSRTNSSRADSKFATDAQI